MDNDAKKDAQDRLPRVEVLQQMLAEEQYRYDYKDAIRTTIYTLVTIAAVALLIATLVFPVLQVYSNSMEPTLKDGSFVLAVKNSLPEQGDVLAFYYNNKILARRVAAVPGDEINRSANGNLFVNGKLVENSNVQLIPDSDLNLEYPYKVPPGQYFVLADNHEALDSSNRLFGCIVEEDMIGTIKFQVWPLDGFGFVK